jgi:MraZ protein
VAEEIQSEAKVPPEPPRGILQARCDEKGRLKLPAAIAQYLAGLGEQKVFITTLDERTTRIYPISVWKQNEIFFRSYQADPAAKNDVWFILNDWGADSEIDSQGRVLVPTELRRHLSIEGQPVWLYYSNGRIDVLSKEVYEERKRRAQAELQTKVETLEKGGML